MQSNQLKPIHRAKLKKRVGRGGKRGTYCGRGVKGQKARSGHLLKPIIREIIKRYPKLRGYRFRVEQVSPKQIIDIEILEKNFNKGDKIDPQILLEKKLIHKMKGRLPKVKFLGKGKLTKSFIIERCQVSKQAASEIEKAGGKVIIK